MIGILEPSEPEVVWYCHDCDQDLESHELEEFECDEQRGHATVAVMYYVCPDCKGRVDEKEIDLEPIF